MYVSVCVRIYYNIQFESIAISKMEQLITIVKKDFIESLSLILPIIIK